ncbi:MAG: endonuclease III [Gammaproteobacteria bacterium]|nr:endonuclease III [Gammaproteobacteria bacterium]MBP9729256.1 endonuclease III [Gammaproteobacteria bacterium]
MNLQKRIALFETFKKQNPDPQTELHYQSPFELLVAVMLSAQATDISVNKATPALFAVANTPEAIRALGETKLKDYVKTINLYPTKAKHIIKTADRLIEHFQGQVPSTREALESLPGVGRKTANVILNTLFDQSVIAVDTHIFRVARRIGLSKASTVLSVEKDLMKNIPKAFLKEAHHWLVLHGRYVCKAQKPQCAICPIQALCEYPQKTAG